MCTLARALGVGECAWDHFFMYSFLLNFTCSFHQLFHVVIKGGWVKELNAFHSSQHVKDEIREKRAYSRSQNSEENSIYFQPTKGLDFDWLNLNPPRFWGRRKFRFPLFCFGGFKGASSHRVILKITKRKFKSLFQRLYLFHNENILAFKVQSALHFKSIF